jgi:hypothetical protein
MRDSAQGSSVKASRSRIARFDSGSGLILRDFSRLANLSKDLTPTLSNSKQGWLVRANLLLTTLDNRRPAISIAEDRNLPQYIEQ